jgi:hypothetical protein
VRALHRTACGRALLLSAHALNPGLLENFLISLLAFNKRAHAKDFAALRTEVRAWLPDTGKLAELLADPFS